MSRQAADALFQALLAASGPVLLTGPVSPDGDSLGACFALARVLRDRGVDVSVTGAPSWRYTWMPGIEGLLPDEDLGTDWQAVVVLDGDRQRLEPGAAAAFDAAPLRGIIDHHASTRPDGYTHPWLEPQATSTCSMLYDAFSRWGIAIDAELATWLYTGLVYDTGGFRYSNTSPATHRTAAHLLEAGAPHVEICTRVLVERRLSGLRLAGALFGAAEPVFDGRAQLASVPLELAHRHDVLEGDLDGVVDALLHVRGVEVSVVLVERPDGQVKYSLRSRGGVDVARLAAALAPSGGGHARAAGAQVQADLQTARARVVALLAEALAAPEPAPDSQTESS